MAIQNNINAALGSIGAAVIAGAHLKNQDKLNKKADEIEKNMPKNQAEVEANMKSIKDAPISESAKKAAGPDAKYAEEGTKEAELLKKYNDESINEIDNKLSRIDKGFEYSETNFDWENIDKEASDIQANIDRLMKERAESILPGKIEAATSRGNFEQIRAAAQNGGKVRPYAIIKGSTTKKKYLD